MADVLAQIEAAIQSGQVDDASLDKLIAAGLGELESAKKNEARAQRLSAAEQEFENETSPGALAKGVASTAWEKLKGLGRGALKLGDMASFPLSMSTNLARGQGIRASAENTAMGQLATTPEARRELGRGLSDSMFGIPARLGDKLGVTHYAETEAHDAAQPEVKDIRTAGAVLGSAAPGSPVQLLGRGSLALAAKTGLSPALAALAAAQLSSGAGAAARAAVDGGDAADAGRAALVAASDPVNAVAPLGVKAVQTVERGAGAVTRALRDDTSALGGGADTLKQLDSMRERGAIRGNLRRDVRDPALASLPRGKKGYVKAAQNARDTIGGNASGDLKAARADYDKEMTAIESEHADRAYPVEGLKARLGKLRTENTVNGEPVDDALGAALDKVDRMTTKKTGIVASDTGREVEANAATVGDLIKVKKAVGDKAQFGMPATPENRPYRLIWRELAAEAEGIDPRIAPLNQKYKATMDRLEETNDILYGQDAPQVADRPAARRRAAGKLMRTGDDTTAGELGDEDIDRLADLDKRNARPIQTLKDKKALERTRFGLPQMSKSPEKWATGLLEQNTEATRARVVDPLARQLAAMGLDPVAAMIIRARLAQQAQQQQGETP